MPEWCITLARSDEGIFREAELGEEHHSSAGVRGWEETGSCRNYGLYILKYRKVNNNFYPKKGFGYATMTSPKERGCHFFYNYYMWYTG